MINVFLVDRIRILVPIVKGVIEMGQIIVSVMTGYMLWKLMLLTLVVPSTV